MYIFRCFAFPKLISRTKVFVVQNQEILGKSTEIRLISKLLSDYDEEITSTVNGPFLIEAADLPTELRSKLIQSEYKLINAYKIAIPDNGHFFGNVQGEYCALYEKEKILTTKFLTAIMVAAKLV